MEVRLSYFRQGHSIPLPASFKVSTQFQPSACALLKLEAIRYRLKRCRFSFKGNALMKVTQGERL